MPILISSSKDPYFNLAIEEYLLKRYISNEDIFMLWHSEKAFVFGRNQNPYVEIDPRYFKDSFPIIRRISGGGTIYQDSFTINYTFITKDAKNKVNNYLYFLKPIIDTLNNLGCRAEFKPKSHIFIDNLKISGNAQAYFNGNLLHHGTLLYDSQLSLIEDALVNFSQTVEGIHVLSNKSKVGNIREFVADEITMDYLEEVLVNKVASYLGIEKKLIEFTDIELKEISEIAENKYKSWDWNFGKTKRFITSERIVDEKIKLEIEHGYVTEVSSNEYIELKGLRFQTEEYFSKLTEFINQKK